MSRLRGVPRGTTDETIQSCAELALLLGEDTRYVAKYVDFHMFQELDIPQKEAPEADKDEFRRAFLKITRELGFPTIEPW